MAIKANDGFFVRMDYSLKTTQSETKGDPDVVTPEITLQVYGNGVIEGEGVLFGIEKSISYDGSMTLSELVAASQAAINGKTADTEAAVAAPKIVKVG